ncbi:zinc finger and BTB domain-containing protein 40 isoform X1 [Synchiropus splendidus]|uniref:zinc finger and BTB domain-containing protein 40 isoform X1 n=2 Tax=Synchiropus splendidus TaxID=270530 RepID=UPI00237E3841|nr:zinc finger and BTB domain-containing protein 40 isoform X1 [Synchiropus splendidus]XP_053725066.1 zinc finger and BTB domain-containing protein 40 isoform X1 [Synchiropus splendidus]XP_053725067.1 zinc finger and BTB domain-containing protein 40 isoform X1 [Synchiropus splendidus]
MLELPNYSSLLLQQLWGLRQQGHFCDCTIMVGDVPHAAHKLVLAASSLLFRSLLTDSVTINIDTDVVSSQDFACLLELLYTGRLPVGKHNASRLLAAADSLQMFHLAGAFRNILSRVVGQQSAQPEGGHQPGRPPCREPLKPEQLEQKCDPQHEPASKRACVKSLSEGPSTAQTSCHWPQTSGLKEALSNMVDIAELLSKAAASSLEGPATEVVTRCCQEAGPAAVVEMLLSRVSEGQLSEADLLRVLRGLQKEAPPRLAALLPGAEPAAAVEELDGATGEPPQQEEEEKGRDQDRGPAGADDQTKEKSEEGPKAAAPEAPTSAAYACRWCRKGFAFKCRMLAHVKRCTMSLQQCPDCAQTLASTAALRRHRAEEHGHLAPVRKKVACDLCERSFAHPSGLVYHKRTEHFEERPFACQLCGSKFGANSSLKNHMRLHTGEKPYQCKQCAARFSVAAALAYHTKRKHSEGKMYECQYCKAAFAQSIELTRHVRTHTGDRPYVCRQCGRGYSQASGLTLHLHTAHDVTEPHDCPKCRLTFASLQEKQEHMEKRHMKESHQCSVCHRTFSSAALLDKHKPTHTGSKPFSCDLCNRSYQQLSGLWYHNRTSHPDVFASHTQQLKGLTQCDVCFKFFPSAASVAQHRAAEHQGSMCRCALCPALLAGEEALQEHVSAQHGGQELQELQEERTTADAPAAPPSVEAPPEQQQQQLCVTASRGKEGGASAQVLELSVYELMNNAVTFICEST